jgi:hypothetical protein
LGYLLLMQSLFFKTLEIHVDKVFLFCEHVPYGDKDFAGDGDLYFHFAFVTLSDLHVAEVTEETVPGS